MIVKISFRKGTYMELVHSITTKLRDNVGEIQERISQAALRSGRKIQDITLVAVTKTVSFTLVQMLLDLGIQHIGENRVQDAQAKFQQITKPATWHLIGHLQRNKVKPALKIFQWFHSIDSIALANELAQQNTHQPCQILLEVNTSGETSKQGFTTTELQNNIEKLLKIPQLNILGLMTMAPLTNDLSICRRCFIELRTLAEKLNQQYHGILHLQHLSMGMSQDYEIAVEEGATMVRVGSALFKGINLD